MLAVSLVNSGRRAEVLLVSTVAVQGRAVVMAVSCWPTSAVAEVLLVSKPPRRCALCAKKFALRGPIVGASAKKFALRAENTLISAFLGLLGEFFRARVVGIPMLGELFSRQPALRPGLVGDARPPCRQRWGFCTTRSRCPACRRRVGPSCSAIPPRRVPVGSRLEVLRRPNCRRPR